MSTLNNNNNNNNNNNKVPLNLWGIKSIIKC